MQSFIEHVHQGESHYLAFVQIFKVVEDEGFFRILRPQQHNRDSILLIGVASINEPVGLLKTTGISGKQPETWIATRFRSLRAS